MSAKAIAVRDIQNGEIYITGPAASMFVRVNKAESREVVTGKVFAHIDCRQCHRPTPSDFRKTAKSLADQIIFRQEPAVRV